VTDNAAPRTVGNDPELDLLNEDQAAALLGLSVSTLQKDRVATGRIPHVKVFRKVFYRRSDLRTFVAQNVRRTTSAP
jgi:hypothetical protein